MPISYFGRSFDEGKEITLARWHQGAPRPAAVPLRLTASVTLAQERDPRYTSRRCNRSRCPRARTVTVVSPVYNEVDGISSFVDRMVGVLEGYTDWELILVDDGSKDGTRQVLRQLSTRDPRIRIVGLARNFGQPIATSAGLAHSSGDVTV